MIRKLICIILSFMALSIFAQNIPMEDSERAKMAKQLSRSIPMELGKIEGAMPQINILIKKGEKVQARTMVNDALQQIANIEADQKILAQLDDSANDEVLMTAEVAEAKRYLINKANQLRNAIGIYITCDAKLFDAEYAQFLLELQGELAQLGVSFIDNAEQADWKINIVATTREYNKTNLNGLVSYFTYADAQLTIEKPANGKRVYADAISEKGGHTLNYEKAGREAYKNLIPKISAIITEQIEK